MARALWTLLGGVLVTLLAAALLTPGTSIATTGFGLVLLTVIAGGVVMVVVARRARQRDRLTSLEDRTPPLEGTDRG